MYDPTRIRYPMKRIGERGSGRWQRLGWDQALEEIADKLIDVITEDGCDCIMFDQGTTNIDNGIASTLEMFLFLRGLAANNIDSWAGVGDLPVGLIQSWGTYMSEGTSDDWFRSDYLVLWGFNPVLSRIPDAHFAADAGFLGDREAHRFLDLDVHRRPRGRPLLHLLDRDAGPREFFQAAPQAVEQELRPLHVPPRFRPVRPAHRGPSRKSAGDRRGFG